jgi:hypothetical protein
MKLGKPRRGDSADMALIEFIDRFVDQTLLKGFFLFFATSFVY